MLFSFSFQQIGKQSVLHTTGRRVQEEMFCEQLYLLWNSHEAAQSITSGFYPFTNRKLTSVSTMCVRSKGCSIMDMKDSPRFVETNVCAIANKRSGRKAWIRSKRWMACPIGAGEGNTIRGTGKKFNSQHLLFHPPFSFSYLTPNTKYLQSNYPSVRSAATY